MQALHSNIKPVKHISGAKTATVTPASGVDLQGYEHGADIMIYVGAITNIGNSPVPSWTFHVEESDSESASFTAVTDSELILIDSSASPVTTPDSSTGVFLTIDAASEDDAVYSVAYVGSKRYIRVVATAADTPGATEIVAVVLARPLLKPASH